MYAHGFSYGSHMTLQVQSVGRTKGDLLRVLSYVRKDGEHNQEMIRFFRSFVFRL